MADVDEATGLEFFLFGGQKRYMCAHSWESGEKCQYDTHDLETIINHMKQPHTRTGRPPRPLSQTLSPILDSKGEKIIKQEVADPRYKNIKFKP